MEEGWYFSLLAKGVEKECVTSEKAILLPASQRGGKSV